MKFTIETEQEEDGRWLAEVHELPGVLAYGKNADDAITKVQALALRVIADRLEHGETLGTPASSWHPQSRQGWRRSRSCASL